SSAMKSSSPSTSKPFRTRYNRPTALPRTFGGGANPVKMDAAEIRRLLPHREPFLFIDEVVDIEPTRRLVALKRVRADEPFFAGHFPGAPVMPGVLIIEALAQAGALLLFRETPDRESKLLFFAGIDQ